MVDYDRLYPDDKDRTFDISIPTKERSKPREMTDCELLKEIRKRWDDSTLLELETSKLLDIIGTKKINKWLKERRESNKK